MNTTLVHLFGRRMWLVSGIIVWGEVTSFEPELILVESDGATARILHGRFAIGGSAQVIKFADLVDQRGNNLPATIANPAVVPIPRSGATVFVQGNASSESFRLSQSGPSNKAAGTDLLIIEMGA